MWPGQDRIRKRSGVCTLQDSRFLGLRQRGQLLHPTLAVAARDCHCAIMIIIMIIMIIMIIILVRAHAAASDGNYQNV